MNVSVLLTLNAFPMLGLTHWQHPSFFGYFPTACTFEGIIGDLYATSATNPGFNVSQKSIELCAHFLSLRLYSGLAAQLAPNLKQL